MSFNRFMHPRNRYKSSPPDFAELAANYPTFREHVEMNLNGKVTVDFKNPEALRALTCTLLKDDYGLDISLPLDRLVPTVPLRLNYIHWIEDLIQQDGNYKGSHVHGIDIGTGASCIYPLLGVVENDWKFTATETDAVNIKYATENIERNDKQDKIKVIKTNEDSLLEKVLENNPRECYTFCMCNPPFYGSPMEAQGLVSRSEDRPEPRSINTAADTECIAEGGEVAFIKKIIADSVKYRERVRWYTSMVGKKKSIWPLKTELKKYKVRTVTTTEFCQGRTMRWGIAWTFTEDDSSLPVSPRKKFKTEKEKPQMKIQVPETFVRNAVERLSITEAIQNRPPATRLLAVQREVEKMMTELQIQYKLLNNKIEIKFELTALHNTWAHQRRKRREALRKELTDVQQTKNQPGTDVELTGGSTETQINADIETAHDSTQTQRNVDIETTLDSAQPQRNADIETTLDSAQPQRNPDIETTVDSTQTQRNADIETTLDSAQTQRNPDIETTVDSVQTQPKSDVECSGESSKMDVDSSTEHRDSCQQLVDNEEILVGDRKDSSGESSKMDVDSSTEHRDSCQQTVNKMADNEETLVGDRKGSSGDTTSVQNGCEAANELTMATCQNPTADGRETICSHVTTNVLSCDVPKNIKEGTNHSIGGVSRTVSHGEDGTNHSIGGGVHAANQSEDGTNHSIGGAGGRQSSHEGHSEISTASESETPLLKCSLTIKNVNKEVVMEMGFIEGKHRDLLHQIAQYFRNQFPKRIQLSPSR